MAHTEIIFKNYVFFDILELKGPGNRVKLEKYQSSPLNNILEMNHL